MSNLFPKFQQCTGNAYSQVCNWFLLVNVSNCQIQSLLSAFEAYWRKMRRVCVFKCFPGFSCQVIKKTKHILPAEPTLHPLSKHGVSFRTAVSQSCGQPWPQTPFQQIADEAITTHDWWPVIQITTGTMHEESYWSLNWRMCEWTIQKGQIQNVLEFGLSLFFFHDNITWASWTAGLCKTWSCSPAWEWSEQYLVLQWNQERLSIYTKSLHSHIFTVARKHLWNLWNYLHFFTDCL